MLPDHGSKAYGYQSEEVKQEVNKIVKDVLTSESMYPLVDQYLDSVSEINSYYLKGEEKIKESLLNEYDKMINPAKDGRKVFHNTILKSAFEIKQNEARRYMHIDYRIQGLNCKLQYPGYYQIDDDKVLQAVAKAGILQEKNIDQMIMEIDNIMNVPVTGTFLLSTDNILHCYRFLRYTKFPHFYHRQLKKFLSCPQAMQSAGFRYCYLK